MGTAFSATRVIPPYETTATEVDWRRWGIVNPIVDQGWCGSCWAFSTIGNTEINYAIATGKLYKYSEQHVNSCDTGNYGCGGGWPSVALSFIANTGTYLGAAYPYISGRTGVTEVCKTLVDPKQKPLIAPGYVRPLDFTYNSFKAELQKGVIDVVFDVQNSFYSYASGIYAPTLDCRTSSGSTVNHAMVGVGYGVSSTGVEFAIVRNSWGTGWGESGYIRVALPQTTVGTCALYTQFYRANAGF